MAKRTYEILDKSGAPARDAGSRYEILTGNLDGKVEMYERVSHLQDNCGWAATYRCNETKSAIAVEFDCNDLATLTLVGEEPTLSSTMDRIRSAIPEIFKFKLIGENNGRKR